jgi:hypothetical protein
METPLRSRRLIRALAIVVFVAVFLYRFNGLGGALGGFDGDHFIYYLGAKQVAHGERPLRDFTDAGLQGAWPALTYELPGLAQKWGGETLLAEAVFVVGAIAVSLTVLFVIAAELAGPGPALAVTLATLFTATKLYGYSKLLVFAVAAALFLRYARRPTVGQVALLAAWSLVAFLFRHDFLVYLVPAVALLIVVRGPGPWRQTLNRLAVYGGLLLLLLLGPLYSIQHYSGLSSYLETHRESTQNERRRTNLRWPQFTAADGVNEFFADEKNAAAWLYYVSLLIPPLALAALFWAPTPPGLDARQMRAVVVSLALLAAVLNWFFLRGNLPGRIGDLGAPIAILAAWLATTARAAPRAVKTAAWTMTALVLIPTALSIGTIGSVWHELDTTGFRDSFKKIGRRIYTVTTELAALPSGGPVFAAAPNAADYLRACTNPTDHVLVIADAPEILAMAERPFAAGQITFRPGFFTLERDQQLMLERLRGQFVPVVLTDEEEPYLKNFAAQLPLIHAYVTQHYELVGELPALAGDPVRVLVRRGHPAARHYGDTGLPCFR